MKNMEKCEVSRSPASSAATSKINHPKHYRHRSGFDAIVWIDRFKMDFCTGNCFKYLFRRGEKDGESLLEDEGKAKWYFRHEVEVYAGSGISKIDAAIMVRSILVTAFGPPGKFEDGSPNWNVGGCDMPEVVKFIYTELTL